MKKLFLFLMVALTVASCNTVKVTATKVKDAMEILAKKYNAKYTVTKDPVTKRTVRKLKFENLYDTTQLKKICEQADIIYKAADGSFEIITDCPEAEKKVEELMADVLSAAGAIVFKK